MSVFYPCDASGFCPYAVEDCKNCKSRTYPKASEEEEESAVERALQVFKWQSKDNVEKVELTVFGWYVYFKDGDIFYVN